MNSVATGIRQASSQLACLAFCIYWWLLTYHPIEKQKRKTSRVTHAYTYTAKKAEDYCESLSLRARSTSTNRVDVDDVDFLVVIDRKGLVHRRGAPNVEEEESAAADDHHRSGWTLGVAGLSSAFSSNSGCSSISKSGRDVFMICLPLMFVKSVWKMRSDAQRSGRIPREACLLIVVDIAALAKQSLWVSH